MAQIAAHEDVKARRVQRDLPDGHHVWRTDFIVASKENPDTPQAFLVESTPKRLLRTHFHEVDQFQVIVRGDGTLAKHKLAPCGVHFARAYTPYGPIINGSEGLCFLTLRARRDPGGGAQFIPEYLEKLKQIPDRKAWQVTQMPQFATPAEEMAVQPLSGVHDENGLAAYSLSMKPHAKALAPDPSNGDGQYVVVLTGSLIRDGREHGAITVAFVAPNEGPLQLVAGSRGLKAVVLNFPSRPMHASKVIARTVESDLETWHCALCSFIYDEAAGIPEEGIPPGTRWADVPDTWGCPDCSATKADFEMIEF